MRKGTPPVMIRQGSFGTPAPSHVRAAPPGERGELLDHIHEEIEDCEGSRDKRHKQKARLEEASHMQRGFHCESTASLTAVRCQQAAAAEAAAR